MKYPLFIVAILMSACAATAFDEPGPVVVAPLEMGDALGEFGMTRDELEVQLRRFADRYMTRIAVVTSETDKQPMTTAEKKLMEGWKTASFAAVIDIAIGPDAVTDLLDMMTLTLLSRMVAEDYWVPEVLGPERGADLLRILAELEKEIFIVADDVLTADQQADLLALVSEWHAENPDQIYPWYVRLSNFSGQRAASLSAVPGSGGLLNEVARTRETVAEVQAFGERALFFLQRAPMITSNYAEYSAANILDGPRITELVQSADRLSASLENLGVIIEDVPDAGVDAANQIVQRLAEEQRTLLRSIADAEPGIRDVLTELLPVLESIRLTAVALKAETNGRPFDVNEYSALLATSTATISELRLLADSLPAILNDDSVAFVRALEAAEYAVLDRIFVLLSLLICIFFAALFGYRYMVHRLTRAQVPVQ